jgi:hypothetical protein
MLEWWGGFVDSGSRIVIRESREPGIENVGDIL